MYTPHKECVSCTLRAVSSRSSSGRLERRPERSQAHAAEEARLEHFKCRVADANDGLCHGYPSKYTRSGDPTDPGARAKVSTPVPLSDLIQGWATSLPMDIQRTIILYACAHPLAAMLATHIVRPGFMLLPLSARRAAALRRASESENRTRVAYLRHIFARRRREGWVHRASDERPPPACCRINRRLPSRAPSHPAHRQKFKDYFLRLQHRQQSEDDCLQLQREKHNQEKRKQHQQLKRSQRLSRRPPHKNRNRRPVHDAQRER